MATSYLDEMINDKTIPDKIQDLLKKARDTRGQCSIEERIEMVENFRKNDKAATSLNVALLEALLIADDAPMNYQDIPEAELE